MAAMVSLWVSHCRHSGSPSGRINAAMRGARRIHLREPTDVVTVHPGAMAAATGASLRELMKRMGHTSTRAALIYQHATRERDEASAAAMGEVLASVRRKGARNRSRTYRARRKGAAS
jgi:hypothetical protein